MKNNGGPAFPVTLLTEDHLYQYFPGMSLRDYFAAKAMQGLCASAIACENTNLARLAYVAADAMIAERDK